MASALTSRGQKDPSAGIVPDLPEVEQSANRGVLRTPSPPRAPRAVAIEIWADLMNVSDTLGKPILRYIPPDPSEPRSYYVHDGHVNYVYSSRRADRRSSIPGTVYPLKEGPHPPGGNQVRSGSQTLPAEPSTPFDGWRTGANLRWPMHRAPLPSRSETELVARTRALVGDLKRRSLPRGALDMAIPHLRWAVASIRAGKLNVASHELLLARWAVAEWTSRSGPLATSSAKRRAAIARVKS
jgi:hypothetical protein